MYAFEQDLHTALRAWAKGIYPLEAGVELLVRTRWARQLDQSGWVRGSSSELGEAEAKYAMPKVGEYLQHAGYLSGGEYRQLTVIASFLGQLVNASDDEKGVVTPFDAQLYEALPGVDHSFIRLVQSAVGHAAGLHEHGGNPLPWPDEDD